MNRTALIRDARAGSAEALGQLLESYRNLLRVLARASLDGALGAKVDASDVAQEALLKAHQRFEQFRGESEGEVVAWLKRILANNVADARRRFAANEGRDLAREQPLEALLDRSSAALGSLLAANGPTPSEDAERGERAVRLADALERLPAEYRDALILRSLQELEWGEVGRRMGRSAGAARMMWGRALRQLGRLLEADA